MTYITRKYTQVQYSLGLEPDYDEGTIERLDRQVQHLCGVVSVLVSILETEGVLSLENSNILDEVKSHIGDLQRLEKDENNKHKRL